MPSILLIEDDPSFGYILSEYLQLNDYTVTWCKTASDSLKVLEQESFDVGIFDIMLPDGNGFDIAQQVKQQIPDMPFLFLSAKTLKIDKLKGYKLGADDYITKPVDEELLMAKLQVILQRNSPAPSEEAWRSIGAYQFNPSIQELRKEHVSMSLTKRESELLHLLCQHQNQLLPRKKALREIWHATDEFSRKSMDVFISKLRKHLAEDPRISIRNVHGKGFILQISG